MSFYRAPTVSRPPAPILALVLLALTASACTPSAQPTPSPSPVPVVHVSPAAAPFAQALGTDFVHDRGPLPFDLIPLSGADGRQAVEAGEAALLIDLPPAPDGWFATPLGRDAVTVIVNEQVTTRNLTLEELRAVFSGQAEGWDELSAAPLPVHVVVPPRGDPLRERFTGAVLGETRVTTQARLAPSPAITVELVAQSPGALGLVPLSADVGGEVRRVRVEGVLPRAETLADGTYPLGYPVLAMAPREPEGALRDWLIWVQGAGDRAAQP